jgi:hyperosmotically inducible protein
VTALLISLFVILLTTFSFGQEISPEDAALTVQIRDAILDDSRLPIDGLSIFVLNGAVRLKGIVETLAQKRWINEVIYRIPEVKVVDNKIAVLAQNFNDNELAQVVKNQLTGAQNVLLDYSKVAVVSNEGDILLKGDINTLGAKIHAEEITAVVKGVLSIDNKLKVRDERNNTDEKIERAVVAALREKIQMNRDFYLKVSVVHGVLTLTGRLSSERDHGIATRTALFTPGVAEIIDKIEVLPQ